MEAGVRRWTLESSASLFPPVRPICLTLHNQGPTNGSTQLMKVPGELQRGPWRKEDAGQEMKAGDRYSGGRLAICHPLVCTESIGPIVQVSQGQSSVGLVTKKDPSDPGTWEEKSERKQLPAH